MKKLTLISLFTLIILISACQKEVESIGQASFSIGFEYNCNYYTLNYFLYNSYYEFYKNKNKAVFRYDDENEFSEKYYLQFFEGKYDENVLISIINQTRLLINDYEENKDNNIDTVNNINNRNYIVDNNGNGNYTINDDKVVEALVSFVQHIEYNCDKYYSYLGLTDDEFYTNYPYETLYLQEGVCEDSSILLSKMLKILGYKVALLEFNDENHMAVGIGCDSYSDYEDYCYIETTSPKRIGIKPILSGNLTISSYPNIIKVSDGKNFEGIKKIKEKQEKLSLEYGDFILKLSNCEEIILYNQSLILKNKVNELEEEKIKMENKLDNNHEKIENLKINYDELLNEYDKCSGTISSQRKYDSCLILYQTIDHGKNDINNLIIQNNQLYEDYRTFYSNYLVVWNGYNESLTLFNNYNNQKSCLENYYLRPEKLLSEEE